MPKHLIQVATCKGSKTNLEINQRMKNKEQALGEREAVYSVSTSTRRAARCLLEELSPLIISNNTRSSTDKYRRYLKAATHYDPSFFLTPSFFLHSSYFSFLFLSQSSHSPPCLTFFLFFSFLNISLSIFLSLLNFCFRVSFVFIPCTFACFFLPIYVSYTASLCPPPQPPPPHRPSLGTLVM